MARRIVRDIEVKKSIRPFTAEGKSANKKFIPSNTASSNAKKSPYILDLSQEVIVNTSVNLADEEMTDIHRTKSDPGMLVVQKMRPPAIGLRLAWIGVLGLCIIFLLNTAKSYTAGQILFSKIAQSAEQGYGQLVQGGKEINNADPLMAAGIFDQAYAQFQQAQNQIWFIRNEPTLSKYTAVLDSGQLLADSGKQMIEIMQEIKAIPDLFAQNLSQVEGARSEQVKTALTQLQNVYPKMVAIRANVSKTLENFQALLEDVPRQYRPVFEKGVSVLRTSEELLTDIVNMLPGIQEIMGNGKPHRTLILLQNNDEIRATGGFIGSFINVQMENGHVTSLKLEDVYDMDGQFKTRIEPPEDIKRLTDRWFFRDSNVSPDFTVSGEKALWFYAQERGESADTVIAVNQDLLGKILRITGPIEVAGLAAPLTADNYREALTYMIETKRSGAADPKKILKDLLPLIQKRLFTSSNVGQFQHTLLEEIVQKDALGYSKNPLTQKLFETLGMDGIMQPETRGEDSIAVIASSFGGNKSDAYIKQDIQHDTIIERDGEIYNQVTIKRTHQWTSATEQKWKLLLRPFNFTDFPEHFLKIFGKSDNKVAMRVYIPSGAELLSADYIPLDQVKTVRDANLGRSYFSFDMITKPGENSTVKLRYKLPFSMNNLLANTYALNIQKQPGARASNFTKNIFFGDFMALAKTYPEEFMMQEDGSLMIGKPLHKDLRLAILMTRDSLKK